MPTTRARAARAIGILRVTLLRGEYALELTPMVGFFGKLYVLRAAYEGGLMLKRQTATPSTPTIGQPFWHQK